MENPKYEEILCGNVNIKVKVARIFLENMKIREQYGKDQYEISQLGPGDRYNRISCLQ